MPKLCFEINCTGPRTRFSKQSIGSTVPKQSLGTRASVCTARMAVSRPYNGLPSSRLIAARTSSGTGRDVPAAWSNATIVDLTSATSACCSWL